MASATETELRSYDPGPAIKAGGWPRRAVNSGWAWMGLACALIGASGLVRVIQDRQFGLVKSSIPPSPFRMEQIPTRIDTWVSQPGDEVKLDPLTVRITGSTDHVMRNYVDELTGAKLSVLVLYGPAEPVAPHTPEVCYPATGWAAEDKVAEFKLPLGSRTARFRDAIYVKSGGGRIDRAKVYYSFRLDGDWAPDIAVGKRFHRTNANIIKVQIQRLIGIHEDPRSANEPVETFLGSMIPEIEGLIAQGEGRPIQSASR